MAPPFRHCRDHVVGHHGKRGVREQAQPGEPAERVSGGLIVVGPVEQLGRHRTELDQGGGQRGAAQVGPQPRRELGEPGLGRGVDGESRQRRHPGQGRQVDDVAPAPAQHPGHHLPAQVDGRDEVHPVHGFELGHREGGDVIGDTEAGVVHQHVDGAAVGLDASDQPGHRRRVGQVVDVRGAAELAGQPGHARLVAVEQRQTGSGLGELPGQRLADPPARTGDQHPPVPQVHGRTIGQPFRERARAVGAGRRGRSPSAPAPPG